MRGVMLFVLALAISIAACKKEVIKPDAISIVVTIEDVHGKMIQFIYMDQLVWESEMGVDAMAYRQDGDLLYIDYLSPTGEKRTVTFKSGQIVGKT